MSLKLFCGQSYYPVRHEWYIYFVMEVLNVTILLIEMRERFLGSRDCEIRLSSWLFFWYPEWKVEIHFSSQECTMCTLCSFQSNKQKHFTLRSIETLKIFKRWIQIGGHGFRPFSCQKSVIVLQCYLIEGTLKKIKNLWKFWFLSSFSLKFPRHDSWKTHALPSQTVFTFATYCWNIHLWVFWSIWSVIFQLKSFSIHMKHIRKESRQIGINVPQFLFYQ